MECMNDSHWKRLEENGEMQSEVRLMEGMADKHYMLCMRDVMANLRPTDLSDRKAPQITSVEYTTARSLLRGWN